MQIDANTRNKKSKSDMQTRKSPVVCLDTHKGTHINQLQIMFLSNYLNVIGQ